MRRRGERFPDNGYEAWGGYMQAKIAKLEDQFSTRACNQVSSIFNGISIYVNGYTKPSADELKELMSQHGGVYHTYQKSNDYIIASNLPDTKVKNMCLVKVVKPEWIMDSIAAKRLLDYRQYLLYKNSRTQPQLNFCKNVEKELVTVDSLQSCVYDKSIKDEQVSNISEGTLFNNCNKDTNKLVSPCSNINTSVNKLPVPTSKFGKTDSMAKTAVDPNFISEFYNNSRLHHISQLGAYFKQHVNDLRDNDDFTFPARSVLKNNIQALSGNGTLPRINFDSGKVIMHIDMDCFFVSVGLRKRPELCGQPVAVTHSKGAQGKRREGVDRATEFNLYKQKHIKKMGRVFDIPEDDIIFENKIGNINAEDEDYGSMSEIASCSYEARAKGIKNGMFMGAALKLCPNLKTIPYDFEGYKEVAYTLYNTIAQYTLDIEAVSCDEMYVDCTELIRDLNVIVQDFATVLRQEIKSKTGCPCSTGFGGNRLQSRLATKKAKPDGQFFLTSDLLEDFMLNINLRELPGVGRQISLKLESLGHLTCGSLQTLTLGLLQRHLGNKTGAQLFDQCSGRDSNPLVFHTVRKSVSAEVNYGIRFEIIDQCFQFLEQLSAEVHSRMQQFKVLGKCITLKMMVRAEEAPMETAKFMGHGFCNVINKSSSLSNPTNDVQIITKEVISLCKKLNIDPKEMRGIGIQITKLEPITSKPRNRGISKFLHKNVNSSSITKMETEDSKHISLPTNVNEYQEESKMKLPVTPKKERFSSSPVKKSPKLGQIKSSPSKKRGRPPKNVKNNLMTKNLMDKFLFGSIQVSNEIQVKKEPDISYTKEENKSSESSQHGILALPWERVRELLRAWLDSGESPKFCDTKMIATYLNKLVLKKDIDKVYILINFLRRRTRELKLEVWTDVYDYVLKEVQSCMIIVYGKKLWVDET